MIQKSYEESNYGKLYLVPTPIGNLSDITMRALEVLKEVDIIFAEDTRETYHLINYYNINKKVESCHKYTEMKHKNKIISLLKQKKNIAYVTDRGTPLISDPGNIIVDEAIKEKITVVSLPGPNALLPAINMSGLSNERFYFYGFLNSKKTIAKKQLQDIKNINCTIIFYESPFRVKETINNMYEVLGNRKAAIVREISKLHEEVIRDNLDLLRNKCENIKGELVIVVEGNKEIDVDNNDYISIVKNHIKEGYSQRDAVKLVAEKYNISKNKLYNEVK